MEEVWAILAGVVAGTVTRFTLLRIDYRAYPSAPNGVLIHGTIGFVASALGAVTIPALFAKDYVAVAFMSLAIQQLRAVREAERDSLTDLEKTAFIPRGEAYIDGLAKGFESRNYVVYLVALVTSAVAFFVPWPISLRVGAGWATGLVLFLVIRKITGHQTVEDCAEIEEAKIYFQDCDLYVDDVFVTNIGRRTQRERIATDGLAFLLTPKDLAAQITFGDNGQRQAIMYEISRRVGVKWFHESRRDRWTGRVALCLVPMKRDAQAIINVIKNVPLIESAKVERERGRDGR